MALLSSSSKATELAPILPIQNSIFARNGITLRRGQFSILATAPSVGKTLIANNIAVHTKVPTEYFSADSDEWTVKQRVCSILTGRRMEQVDKDMQDESWIDYYTEQLHQVDHIDWCYRVEVDPAFIALRTKAYAEINGDWPHLIVVDNLRNTVDAGGDDSADLRTSVRELQILARTTKAHVMGLHHVMGDAEDGYTELTLKSLYGKVGKDPECVYGANWIRGREDALNFSVLKQRGGKARFSVYLPVDYETASVGGFRG